MASLAAYLNESLTSLLEPLAIEAVAQLESRPGRSRLALANAAKRVRLAVGTGSVRRVKLPSGLVTIGVGGSTLGGSYRTPTVEALARLLVGQGLCSSVELVILSHGYGARVPQPTYATLDDPGAFGDEAALLARALGPLGVSVVTGGSWQEKLQFARKSHRVVLCDGLLQASPRALDYSLLALDADCPWGSGCLVPLGDLRDAPEHMLAACNYPVLVGEPANEPANLTEGDVLEREPLREALRACIEVALPPRLPRRVGLFAGVARPERLLRSLTALGCEPTSMVRARDHAVAGRVAFLVEEARRLDLSDWLVPRKCLLGVRRGEVPGLVLHPIDAALEFDAVSAEHLTRSLRQIVALEGE
jgi:tetraacyldisaccharide 4'-kinase